MTYNIFYLNALKAKTSRSIAAPGSSAMMKYGANMDIGAKGKTLFAGQNRSVVNPGFLRS